MEEMSIMEKRKEEEVNAMEEEDDMMLPGFRFHPTDEELVGFYLPRKVEKKPLSIEIIKEIDIYKHEPWDLPKAITAGEKESYFFCRRGRKYKNSVRPNRVTGCGFWKATGIDRSIHSSSGNCIGLKKSLVYYRGSAGKGTKTDWMMHEFRHPSGGKVTGNSNTATMQEAEVWTICRVFKRSVSYKKQPNSYKLSAHRQTPAESSSIITSCFESDNVNDYRCSASSAAAAAAGRGGYGEVTTMVTGYCTTAQEINNYSQAHEEQLNYSICRSPDPLFYPSSTVHSQSIDDFLKDENWNELERMVEFMADQSLPYENTLN